MMNHEADYNFSRRIEALHRHRKWITAGTTLSALFALVVSLILPKIYRATTFILVSESKIEANSQYSMWQYSLIRTYVPFVDSDALISRAIRDLHLDQAPYDLTVDRFRRDRYLDVDIPKGTRLLEIDVEFPDARLAAELANYLAQNAATFNTEVTMKETQNTQAFLKQHMDQAAQHLANIENDRLKIRRDAGIEDKDKEASILLEEKAKISSQLQQFRMTLAQSESELKTIAEELSKVPHIISLKKSVDSDNYVSHTTERLRGNTDGLVVSEETVSNVHEKLQQQYDDALTQARSSEAGARAGEADLASINSRIKLLLETNAVKRSEIERIDREYALAKENMEAASRSYQNASIAVTAQSQDLKQLAPAQQPERPVRPNIILNTVLATFLSFALLSMSALTWEGFRSMKWIRPDSIEQEEELLASPR
jgi:uncharacterized protein involved in exopolysaccharide biosynthesis